MSGVELEEVLPLRLVSSLLGKVPFSLFAMVVWENCSVIALTFFHYFLLTFFPCHYFPLILIKFTVTKKRLRLVIRCRRREGTSCLGSLEKTLVIGLGCEEFAGNPPYWLGTIVLGRVLQEKSS